MIVHRKDYRVPSFLLDSVYLNIAIFDGYSVVSSDLTFTKNPASSDDSTLRLDGEHLELLSLAIDGTILGPSEYSVTETSLIVPNYPKHARLHVEVKIFPEANKALSGLYRSSSVYCTQCEAEGFRRITYFPDRPDVMSTYKVRIEADADTCPVLLSNGNLLHEGKLAGNRHFAVWEDPFKKPSYLFAAVAGKLERMEDSFVTMSGRRVRLFIYTEKGYLDQCAWAMESLKRAMKWDEETYGREYDLDLFNIVAVSDFNFGAMENKSLNIFNTSAIFASKEKTEDSRFIVVEAIIAHEYFHNWTGDRITCRDWFQLTLKEGLTVFRDQSFTQDLHSRAVNRIEDVAMLRSVQFAEDQGPMAHPIRPESYEAIDNFYTSTVYDKGAEIIRMMQTILGPANYRKGTDLYFERFDGQAVTCDDFVQCMQDASGIDLGHFKLWYQQAGTPLVAMKESWDAKTSKYTLTLSQSYPTQPKNKPVHIPVRFALLDKAGQMLALDAKGNTELTLALTSASQTFTFDNIVERPVASVLREFSAPVNLERDASPEDLAFLMAHDTDGFSRYEAAFSVKKRELLARISGQGAKTGINLVALTGEILRDRSLEPDLKAKLLTLPGQDVLEQAIDSFDPQLIFRVRRELQQEIVTSLRKEFLDLYQRHHKVGKGTGFPSDKEMAARSLKNTALTYLGFIADDEIYAIAAGQYRSAVSMSDRLEALGVFVDSTRPERAEFLDDFYQRFKDDRLVIDKWFAIQSAGENATFLRDFDALRAHPDFEVQNPNRARAVYGTFSRGNPKFFHDAAGKGYAILADAVLTIDAFNPTTSSRLVQAFQNWKRLADPYRSVMKRTLENVAAKESLSKNLREMVERYLA